MDALRREKRIIQERLDYLEKKTLYDRLNSVDTRARPGNVERPTSDDGGCFTLIIVFFFGFWLGYAMAMNNVPNGVPESPVYPSAP